MAAKSSLNEHIDETVKRYSTLFTLPSHKTLLIELCLVCLSAGILVNVALRLSQPYGLMLGLILGGTFYALTLATDFIIYLSSVNVDPVFNMRRCSALSLYSLLLWFVVMFIGVVVNLVAPGVWFRFFLLGFCATLALRLLVFLAVSFAGLPKIAVFAGLQPVLYLVSVVYTASVMSTFNLNTSLLAFSLLSVGVTIAAMCIYMYLINRVGFGLLGVGSFSVLRAFMANWTEDWNGPFEQLFEQFSQENEITISRLSFRNSQGHVKATMIVPAFHPGPFKNIGSSGLPYLIQEALGKKLENCVVIVPHGLSGHSLDLATQTENQIVVERTLKLSEPSTYGPRSTPFLRFKRNGANVGCQVFNSCALVTLTLAPETMEDLPPELNEVIIQAAKSHGLSGAIAIDAHNSINGPFKTDEAVKPLQEAALACLKEASRREAEVFQVGVALVRPAQFGLKEGMGPGGIGVLVVKVGDQTVAYVTIDGNNMITGVREKILMALAEIGINDGEVFTTDTHVVNAVVLNARGYHPIGEAMDHGVLTDYIKRAAKSAMENLEPAEVSWASDTVSNVKVIGEGQIAAMATLLKKATRRARNLAVLIFPLVGVALVALLLLL